MGMNIHASCVVLARSAAAFDAPGEAGILLLGPSGAGKSDLALRLIAAGAELVADDRTVLTVREEGLFASPPAELAGLLEVRNLGIVALSHWPEARISLVAELGTAMAPDRLPVPERWATPPQLGLPEAFRPPLVRLNPFEASAPVKIAIAAAAFARDLLRGAAGES